MTASSSPTKAGAAQTAPAQAAQNASQPPVPQLTDEQMPDIKDGPLTALQSIHAVMSIVEVVAKTQYNDFAKYNFRGVDAIYNAVGPALRRVGAVVTNDVIKITRKETKTSQGKDTLETVVKLRVRWYGTDGGEPIESIVYGETLENSDKGLAQAISVAMRTYFINLLVIPTGDTDPDAQTTERGAAARSPRARAAAPARGTQPATPRPTIAALQSEIVMRSPGLTVEEVQAKVFDFLGITSGGQVTIEGLQSYLAHLHREKAGALWTEPPAEEPDPAAPTTEGAAQ